MRHLLWIGCLATWLPLACGTTTRDPVTGDEAVAAAGGETEPNGPFDGNDPMPSSGGQATNDNDPPDSADPDDTVDEPAADSDPVHEFILMLSNARFYRDACVMGEGPPPPYLAPGAFFTLDPSPGFELGGLERCMHDFPDQEAIASLIECWSPPLEDVASCWKLCPPRDDVPRSEWCTRAAYEGGYAPNTFCLDHELLEQLRECSTPQP